jgi:hypothetical protein
MDLQYSDKSWRESFSSNYILLSYQPFSFLLNRRNELLFFSEFMTRQIALTLRNEGCDFLLTCCQFETSRNLFNEIFENDG